MLRRMSAIEVTVEAIRAKGDEDARRIMQALMEIKVDLARMSK